MTESVLGNQLGSILRTTNKEVNLTVLENDLEVFIIVNSVAIRINRQSLILPYWARTRPSQGPQGRPLQSSYIFWARWPPIFVKSLQESRLTTSRLATSFKDANL